MAPKIITQHRDAPIIIFGNTYQGADQIGCRKKGTEIIPIPNEHKFDIYLNCEDMYVLRWAELFPCFDVYDRMNEDRFYGRYIICKTEQEAMEKYQYCIDKQLSMSTLDDSYSPLAPIIFADDERPEIQIMIDQEQNIPPINESPQREKSRCSLSRWFRKS